MAKPGSKKNSSPEDEIDPMGWMMTFGDMVTLLLTFFVLLMTMASMDDKMFRDAWGSVVAPPVIVAHNIGGSGTFLAPPPLPRPPRPVAQAINTEKDVILIIEEHLEQRTSRDIQTYNTGRGVVLKFKDDLLFAEHSTDLLPEAQIALMELAQGVLERIEFDLIVEGSTDRQPLPVSAPYANHLELSAQRALVVTQHLLAHSKLKQTQISCRGRGFRDCPIDTPNNPSRNCVEIVIDTKTTTK